MKSLIRLSLIVSLLAASLQSLACGVDPMPQTAAEFDRQIRETTLALQMARETEKMYKDLASEAQGTAAKSYFAAAGSAFGAMFVSPMIAVIGTAVAVTSGAIAYDRSNPADKIDRKNCTFSGIRTQLATAREQVMQNFFDGSAVNSLQDHTSLGSVSALGTIYLYQISALERFNRESELKSLLSLKQNLGR